MHKLLIGIAVFLLVIHGLIHLIGTTVYMKLGQIQALPYKTTLLGGRVDLGVQGIRWFGALWVLPTLGFVLCAVALIGGWPCWRPLLVGVTIASLALTALDWSVAYAGAIFNLVILGAVWLGPRILSWLAR